MSTLLTPNNPAFASLLHKMAEMHNRKSHDYATAANPYSNFEYAARLAEDFADPLDKVFAVLIGVKLARLSELRGKGKATLNESVQDTFLDLAVYATIWAAKNTPVFDAAAFEKVKAEIQAHLPADALGPPCRTSLTERTLFRPHVFTPHLSED